jgi:hemoglobin
MPQRRTLHVEPGVRKWEGTMAEPSLYERLGGVFAIAAVVDHFSDAIIRNAMVGEMSKNPDFTSGRRTTLTGCLG